MRYRAVLWDFDDTMVETEPARVAAMQRVFDTAGIALDARKFWDKYSGLTFEWALTQVVSDATFAEELSNRYRQTYWTEEHENLRPFAGIPEVLTQLKAASVRLAVVTTKRRDFKVLGNRVGAQHQLEFLGLDKFIDHIVGLADVSKPKPHPEGALLALQQLQIEPANAIFVGDSKAVIQAAKAAGCASALAIWGTSPNRNYNMEDLAPDFVVHTPEELTHLVLDKRN